MSDPIVRTLRPRHCFFFVGSAATLQMQAHTADPQVRPLQTPSPRKAIEAPALGNGGDALVPDPAWEDFCRFACSNLDTNQEYAAYMRMTQSPTQLYKGGNARIFAGDAGYIIKYEFHEANLASWPAIVDNYINSFLIGRLFGRLGWGVMIPESGLSVFAHAQPNGSVIIHSFMVQERINASLHQWATHIDLQHRMMTTSSDSSAATQREAHFKTNVALIESQLDRIYQQMFATAPSADQKPPNIGLRFVRSDVSEHDDVTIERVYVLDISAEYLCFMGAEQVASLFDQQGEPSLPLDPMLRDLDQERLLGLARGELNCFEPATRVPKAMVLHVLDGVSPELGVQTEIAPTWVDMFVAFYEVEVAAVTYSQANQVKLFGSSISRVYAATVPVNAATPDGVAFRRMIAATDVEHRPSAHFSQSFVFMWYYYISDLVPARMGDLDLIPPSLNKAQIVDPTLRAYARTSHFKSRLHAIKSAVGRTNLIAAVTNAVCSALLFKYGIKPPPLARRQEIPSFRAPKRRRQEGAASDAETHPLTP